MERSELLPSCKSFRPSIPSFYDALSGCDYIFGADSVLALSIAALVRCAGTLRDLVVAGPLECGKTKMRCFVE